MGEKRKKGGRARGAREKEVLTILLPPVTKIIKRCMKNKEEIMCAKTLALLQGGFSHWFCSLLP